MADQTHIHRMTVELHRLPGTGKGDGLQVVYSPESGVVLIQADVSNAGWTTIAEMTLAEFRHWVYTLDNWATFLSKV